MQASSTAVSPANVQGFILRGYTHPFSCHLLYTIAGTPPAAAGAPNPVRNFFAALMPFLQSATSWGDQKPASMLNVGITFPGLSTIGQWCPDLEMLSAAELNNFPISFQIGAAGFLAQPSLDDIGLSAPATWWNGDPRPVHVVLHVYGLTEADLAALLQVIDAAAAASAFEEIQPLASGRLYQSLVSGDPDKIHFGYTDGISEPALDPPGTNAIPTPADLANFLIGYPNDAFGGIQGNPPAPYSGAAGAFAKDGCYNAFRVIYQDSAAFEALLESEAKKLAGRFAAGETQGEIQEWIAAKLIGRWRNGTPLMTHPDKPGPDPYAKDSEGFGYVDGTYPGSAPTTVLPNDLASAVRCPFSAHTRVANPRDQSLKVHQEGTQPPRILRRGVPYGKTFAGGGDDKVDRGLVGLFFCGDFSNQFEKLYSWMNYNSFSPVFSRKSPPQDAVLGNRDYTSGVFANAAGTFTIPMADGNNVVLPVSTGKRETMPPLLVTRGTAYCLLPSMGSLALIAGIKP